MDGVSKLIQAYPGDVENKFEEALIQFSELLETDLLNLNKTFMN